MQLCSCVYVASCVIALTVNIVEPRLTAISVTRSPRCYGHCFWPPDKNDHTFSCKENLVNAVTSLLRPNVFGPLVTVLTEFHFSWGKTEHLDKYV